MPFIVKNTTFPTFFDLISPHSCRGCGRIGEPLCECCKNYIFKNHTKICPNCKTKKTTDSCKKCPDLPPIFVVSTKNSLLGSLIHDYKYHSVRALAKPLSELLDSCLPKNLPKNSILVPLPTATHHVRARGFDHTYLIAKNLGRLRHLEVKKLLIRRKNTVQVGANREERLSQASLAYTLNPKNKIEKDATYILLDDVWTTGASIKAAIQKLRQAGVGKIIICLLAYAEGSDVITKFTIANARNATIKPIIA